MPEPLHCPMCGHDAGDAILRETPWLECNACGERIPNPHSETPFDESLLDVPLLAVGEVLMWSGVVQTFFLLAMTVVAGASAAAVLLAWSLCGLLVTACQTYGGWLMARRRMYGWAVAGAIAGLFPFSCAWIVSAPVGVWALCLLSLSDVRQSFE